MAIPHKASWFWVVWCPTGRTPTVKHYERRKADAEAGRLSRENPGLQFFVLKAVGGVFTPPSAPTDIHMVDPMCGEGEIPF